MLAARLAGVPPIHNPLSIALVTDWCPPRVGGIERHVAGLARALVVRGHAVHLFTTTHAPTAIPGVTIHQVTAPMIGDVAAPQLWRVGELRRMLVDAAVDVVHAHGMFSTLAIGGVLAAHGARLPSVTTHHSMLRDSPTLPAAWLTYCLFSHRATIVTAVSEAAAADARRVSGRRDVAILPNGLDRSRWTAETDRVRLKADTTYQQESADMHPDRLRIVSVMRLARKKSPRDLVAAVPRVLAQVRRDVVFTIVGGGPERAALEQLAGRLGVASRIEFLGQCDAPAVAGVLARSHLFALPSRREAFGLAILEARAAGLPIVARASGGVPEIVVHGRQGILTHTADEFADAVAAIVNDDRLREQFASASREGLDAYDWDRVIDRHETVYRQAIASVG